MPKFTCVQKGYDNTVTPSHTQFYIGGKMFKRSGGLRQVINTPMAVITAPNIPTPSPTPSPILSDMFNPPPCTFLPVDDGAAVVNLLVGGSVVGAARCSRRYQSVGDPAYDSGKH